MCFMVLNVFFIHSHPKKFGLGFWVLTFKKQKLGLNYPNTNYQIFNDFSLKINHFVGEIRFHSNFSLKKKRTNFFRINLYS